LPFGAPLLAVARIIVAAIIRTVTRPPPRYDLPSPVFRSGIAEALERALGFRAGRRHWHSTRGNLYAIELGDFGRGRPSMALVYGFWPRFEPRPVSDDEIDEDLAELCLWVAGVCDELEVSDMEQVLLLSKAARAGGDSFRLPI
jgi:hypothetical protein